MRGFSSPESQTGRSSFKAEFGPMRFEPSIQPRIEGLCTELGIEFTAFPPPLDAPSPSRHRLAEDEHDDGGQPLGALQLLKLGVFRMFGQKTTFDGEQRVVLDDPSWLDQLDDDIEDGVVDCAGRQPFPRRGRSSTTPVFGMPSARFCPEKLWRRSKTWAPSTASCQRIRTLSSGGFSGCACSSSHRGGSSMGFPRACGC